MTSVRWVAVVEDDIVLGLRSCLPGGNMLVAGNTMRTIITITYFLLLLSALR
jgi:hypothetical protein